MKIIEFYPSGCKGGSFLETERAIAEDREHIKTSSMVHLSFSLIDKGYTIILVSAKGDRVKMYPGMDAPNGKKVERGHNISKMLINGVFAPWLE